MGPTLVALAFAGVASVARTQGTMDFSGAQTPSSRIAFIQRFGSALQNLQQRRKEVLIQ